MDGQAVIDRGVAVAAGGETSAFTVGNQNGMGVTGLVAAGIVFGGMVALDARAMVGSAGTSVGDPKALVGAEGARVDEAEASVGTTRADVGDGGAMAAFVGTAVFTRARPWTQSRLDARTNPATIAQTSIARQPKVRIETRKPLRLSARAL